MDSSTLALDLRHRQLDAAIQPVEVILRTSDKILISCYCHCPHCLGMLFADPDAAVREASSTDDFIEACNAAISKHMPRCPKGKTS